MKVNSSTEVVKTSAPEWVLQDRWYNSEEWEDWSYHKTEAEAEAALKQHKLKWPKYKVRVLHRPTSPP